MRGGVDQNGAHDCCSTVLSEPQSEPRYGPNLHATACGLVVGRRVTIGRHPGPCDAHHARSLTGERAQTEHDAAARHDAWSQFTMPTPASIASSRRECRTSHGTAMAHRRAQIPPNFPPSKDGPCRGRCTRDVLLLPDDDADAPLACVLTGSSTCAPVRALRI